MKKAFYLLFISLVMALPALAVDPPPIDPVDPDPVPVDGGASLLAAAGIGYGLRRLRQKRAAKAAK
jgi:hypothetical protein